jgi:hypothetical protein
MWSPAVIWVVDGAPGPDQTALDSVRAMSNPTSLEESEAAGRAVNLILGLFVVCGLLFISVIALGSAWLGGLLGVVELGVAWRVTPPAGARSLRWITCMFGVFTLAFSVLWLIQS